MDEYLRSMMLPHIDAAERPMLMVELWFHSDQAGFRLVIPCYGYPEIREGDRIGATTPQASIRLRTDRDTLYHLAHRLGLLVTTEGQIVVEPANPPGAAPAEPSDDEQQLTGREPGLGGDRREG